MRYRTTTRRAGEGHGRKAFWAFSAAALIIVAGLASIRPPAFTDCKTIDNTRCGCPGSPDAIKRRNVIVVDTTDALRKGKYADIELLISSFAGGGKPFADWIADGKKADVTSIFLLGTEAPPDMQPIATFCSMPPAAAMLASDFNAYQMRRLEEAQKAEVKAAVEKAVSATGAIRSPIIEALSVIAGNASHWSPGGNLILVSDLLQNTAECGLFESAGKVPPFAAIPRTCRPFVVNLQERLRPTTTYREPSVVALCTLPGKQPKEGLLAFWREIFQHALGYDVVLSCDPLEIDSRRSSLASRVAAPRAGGSQ